jgi:hypothetical protein
MVRYNLYKCFLDFVHRLFFYKITTFRKLDILPSSGKKRKDKHPSSTSGPNS